ncbi:MAG: hypothetical protein LBG75_03645 [Candidatus Nomurabacteria bacterium]|jgi:hypothetical protein|nr:hypothetical protein [Candidatus Nomurabacteria bacterium]
MQKYSNTTNFCARRSSGYSRNTNTVRFKPEVKLGPVTHTVFVALLITVLGLIYLTQAAKITGYDYESEKIDKEIARLTEQKEDIEVENARLTALSTVSGSDVAKDMVKPATVGYTGQ